MTGSIPNPRLEAAAKALVRYQSSGLCDENYPEQCLDCDCFHAQTKAATGHGFKRELEQVQVVLAAADAADEASGVRRVTAQELADSPAAMLREFHAAYGLLVAETPTFPPAEVADLRHELLSEEFREYKDALAAGDMIELADALADMVYVIYGTALTYGVDLDAVLAEVHRSNMSKCALSRC